MRRFVFRRLLLTGIVLAGVTVAAFTLIRLAPGDPAELLAGPDASREDIAALREKMGLDEPIPIQYAVWVGDVARGDLGRSFTTGRPVVDEIADRIGATLLLAFTSLALAAMVGITAGVVAAVRRGRALDRFVTFASLGGVSVPAFALGIALIVVFAVWLKWLPPGGMFSPAGDRGVADLAVHILLPAVALAARPAGIIARLTRSEMLDVLHQDYVRTAFAKGVPSGQVYARHALRNAMIPVVTVLGVQLGYLLGGAVVVEAVFAWPGLGSLVLRSITRRDYAVIQGALLVTATLFVMVNLAVDLLYGVLNPRIRQ